MYVFLPRQGNKSVRNARLDRLVDYLGSVESNSVDVSLENVLQIK